MVRWARLPGHLRGHSRRIFAYSGATKHTEPEFGFLEVQGHERGPKLKAPAYLEELEE